MSTPKSPNQKIDAQLRELRKIASAYWAEDPSQTPSGFVMIHAGKVCGWASHPDPTHYVPGVAAVPPAGEIRWTVGGTLDGAARWSDVLQEAPRLLQPGTGPEILDAIEQLQGSERGSAAARAFRDLLSNGGAGLDTDNWRALETLCRACRVHGGSIAYKIRDTLTARG